MGEISSEQFFLKWNNFESNLASGFADLLQREAMVDVTLAAEGRLVQAHKIILSICSSYFRKMFQANPCQHPIVVLKDVRYQELTDMLDFMYKGEANVKQEDLPSFLKLAETLRVKGLAVNPGESDENSREKSSDSQVSTVTKETTSFVREESFSDGLERDTPVPRKKSKRCTSPLVYTETKDLQPNSPNVKSETEECDISINSVGHIIKEERLSDNSVDSYGDNLVVNESIEIDKKPGPSTLEENSDAAPQAICKKLTTDYSFVESSFGGLLLILNGFAYRRKSIAGGKSYWFCCKTQCPGKGTLFPNGQFHVTYEEHNHDPDPEYLKRKGQLVELKKLALKVKVSGKDLLQALDMKDDVKKNLNFINVCRKRNKSTFLLHNPVKVGLDYKVVPSPFSGKSFLFHSGYLYRQDSSHPRQKGLKYWKCRLRDCTARAKTDDAGNMTLTRLQHNHPAEEFPEFESEVVPSEVTTTVVKTDEENFETFPIETQEIPLKEEKTEMDSSSDSDAFSIDKLMADTLAENYSEPSGLDEPFN